MCRPLVLHHNKQGCISWCTECDHLNIAFGTVLFTLTTEQFYRFRSLLNKDAEQYRGRGCCRQKSIHYHTDSRKVNIVLSYVELVQLTSIINYSALLFDAYRLIRNR